MEKVGDTLIEKRILIGLNDDTNVKVISGLSPNEAVITNSVTGENKKNSSDAKHAVLSCHKCQEGVAGGKEIDATKAQES